MYCNCWKIPRSKSYAVFTGTEQVMIFIFNVYRSVGNAKIGTFSVTFSFTSMKKCKSFAKEVVNNIKNVFGDDGYVDVHCYEEIQDD